MKKTTISVIASTLLLVSTANAAIDLEVGIGSWNPDVSGDVKYGTNNVVGTKIGLDEIGLNDNSSSTNYYFVDFKHFIPIIPNVRIEKLSYKISGSSKLTKNIAYGDTTLTASTDTKSSINMSQTDMIAYWSVPLLSTLSAGVFDLQYGIDAKKFDGSIKINDEKSTFDETIPLAYLRAIVDIPIVDVELSASSKFISYDDAKIYDNEIKASYVLPIPTPLIDIKIDLGYKKQGIDIPESLTKNADIKLNTSGIFYGLSAKF